MGDDPRIVLANRKLLIEQAKLPSEPLWLNQVHGTAVVEATGELYIQPPEADASVSFKPNQVCVVLTADCLPILLCDKAGTCVSAIHAGWRGLAAGVIEAAVQKLTVSSSRKVSSNHVSSHALSHVPSNALPSTVSPQDILAWLGPAIGPKAFEVGEEVLLAFKDCHNDQCFMPIANKGKWLADLYQLARCRLERLGITAIFGGDFCTYSESERFYSFRRSNKTGRMASLIWRI